MSWSSSTGSRLMFANLNKDSIQSGFGERMIFATRPRWDRIKWPVLIACAILAVISAVSLAGIRYNITESMPVGFYKMIDAKPSVGSIIVFCPPVARRYEFMPPGSCPNGEAPYIKSAVAGPGDVVEVTIAGVSVNGRRLPDSASFQRAGLPHAYGVWTLTNQLWAYGSGLPAHSFDSRYFGPVSIDQARVVISYGD